MTTGVPTSTRASFDWGHGARVASRLGRMQLIAARVAAGLVVGTRESRSLGSGSDRADARPYIAGDDVRAIDWAATARSNETIVRTTLAERELLFPIVVDGNPSMAFGTETLTKYELAICIAAALAEVALRNGDHVAIGHAAPGAVRWLPATVMRDPLQLALRRLAGTPPEIDGGEESRLADSLWSIGRNMARSRLVVVVSDLRSDGWEAPLRALAAGRRVVVIEPFDRRERMLVSVGELALQSGNVDLLLDTDDDAALVAFAQLAEARAVDRRERVTACGAEHIAVQCETDVDAAVVEAIRVACRKARG